MQPPGELMVQEFLPAMRNLVARELRSQGLSQNRISSLLGVTQASVSLYLASDSRRSLAALSALSLSSEDAGRYAALLAEDVKRSAVDAVGTLSTLWTGLLGSGGVCPRHRSLHPALVDCDVCVRSFGKHGTAFSEALSEVSEAVKRLEATPDFASAMPEVSVNVALAVGDAKTSADVVAVPGRIVRVRGRPKAMLPPEPGASNHLSRVLLLVRTRRPRLRACVNLRYDGRMAGVVRRLGLRPLTVGGYPRAAPGDLTVNALESKLRSWREGFDVLVDLGGAGIEPNLYLFAEDAAGAVDLALKVSKAYSAGRRPAPGPAPPPTS